MVMGSVRSNEAGLPSGGTGKYWVKSKPNTPKNLSFQRGSKGGIQKTIFSIRIRRTESREHSNRRSRCRGGLEPTNSATPDLPGGGLYGKAPSLNRTTHQLKGARGKKERDFTREIGNKKEINIQSMGSNSEGE